MSQTQGIAKAKRFSMLALLVMLIGSVGMDQITKITAEDNLLRWSDPSSLKIYQGRSIPVWSVGKLPKTAPEFGFYLGFQFNYVRNQGAAWAFSLI